MYHLRLVESSLTIISTQTNKDRGGAITAKWVKKEFKKDRSEEKKASGGGY